MSRIDAASTLGEVCMRSTVRLFAACAAMVIGVGNLAACSESEEAAVDPHVADIDDTLKQMDGVKSVSTDENGPGGSVSLTVNLLDTVSDDALDDIARVAKEFVDTPLKAAAGGASAHAELVRGTASYSYFAPSNVDEVEAQVAYWVKLSKLGFSSVRVDTMSSFAAAPASAREPAAEPAATAHPGGETVSDATGGVLGHAATSTPSASPTASAPPTATTLSTPSVADAPRYVHLDAPSTLKPTDAAALVEQVREIDDPGANDGAWDLTLLDGRVRGEFLAPGMPSVKDVSRLASYGEELAKLEGQSAIHLVETLGAIPERRAELALFDGKLSTQSHETIENAFLESASGQTVERILGRMDEDVDTWRLSVVGSPIAGASNFAFTVDVSECAFHGDDDWHALSEHLGNRWLAGRATSDPRSVATGRCHVAA